MERRLGSVCRLNKNPRILYQLNIIHPIIHVNDPRRYRLLILQRLAQSDFINILAIVVILWVDHDRQLSVHLWCNMEQ